MLRKYQCTRRIWWLIPLLSCVLSGLVMWVLWSSRVDHMNIVIIEGAPGDIVQLQNVISCGEGVYLSNNSSNNTIFVSSSCAQPSARDIARKCSQIYDWSIRPTYESIVGTTGRWSTAKFHFPGETLCGMTKAGVAPGVDLHMDEDTYFVRSWLNLVNQSTSRVRTGVVHAKQVRVVIPCWCGGSDVKAHMANMLDMLITQLHDEGDPKYLLLIHRDQMSGTNGRVMSNRDFEALKRYAIRVFDHLQPIVLRDTDLPNVTTILQYFRHAKVVIAAHGAVLTHVIVMKKDTCVYELHHAKYPYSFQHIAREFKIKYVRGPDYDETSAVFNFTNLQDCIPSNSSSALKMV